MTYESPRDHGVPQIPPPPPPPPRTVNDGLWQTQQYAPPGGIPPLQSPQYHPGHAPSAQYTPDGKRLATTGVRVGARAIDFVLLSIVSFIGSLISSAALGNTLNLDAYRVTSAVISLVISLGAVAYFVLGETVFGTTVGKLILGVTVRSMAGGASHCRAIV
jgi:hypothetical protein